MTPADLAAAGRALAGSGRWRRPLADMLGCNDRLVRRWADGQAPVPEWAEERISDLIRERRAELSALKIEKPR